MDSVVTPTLKFTIFLEDLDNNFKTRPIFKAGVAIRTVAHINDAENRAAQLQRNRFHIINNLK